MLAGMTAEPIALGHVAAHWDELLRLATSIRTGTVTASAMLRKLCAYPRQNGLALALREVGRLERSIFMLDWLRDIDLRRRTQAGLNKGEARNALARALFFNCLPDEYEVWTLPYAVRFECDPRFLRMGLRTFLGLASPRGPLTSSCNSDTLSNHVPPSQTRGERRFFVSFCMETSKYSAIGP